MPDEQALAKMYGIDYTGNYSDGSDLESPGKNARVGEWLRKERGGVFLDYGCGAGELLKEAKTLGWQTVGVEFDDDVAKEIEGRTGADVLTLTRSLPNHPIADVLHLGDVIEHLTDLNRQMPEILGLLKPGGLFLAQGPLEANASLFTQAIRLGRIIRRSPRTDMPPYHVLLATNEGQRALFRRLGLEQLEYALTEVAWPAPDRLSGADLISPRVVGLFALRRLSQFCSGLRPDRLGNRYFYAGRLVK